MDHTMTALAMHNDRTACEALLVHYLTSINAVENTIAALQACAPNQRSRQSNATHREAQQEHTKRVQALVNIRQELTKLAETAR